MGWDGTQVAAKRNFCEHHSKAVGELCSFPKEQRFAPCLSLPVCNSWWAAGDVQEAASSREDLQGC